MQTTSTTGSYIVYASLLVSALAHFGWILSSNDAIAIVAGIVALAGNIYQHYAVKKTNTAGIAAGTMVPRKG